MSGHHPLTSNVLDAASQQEQKQMFGENIFPLVQKMYPDHAEKITGMLLEFDNCELLKMLEDHEFLEGKVKEATEVLQVNRTGTSGEN